MIELLRRRFRIDSMYENYFCVAPSTSARRCRYTNKQFWDKTGVCKADSGTRYSSALRYTPPVKMVCKLLDWTCIAIWLELNRHRFNAIRVPRTFAREYTIAERFPMFSKRSFSRPSPAYPKIINLPFVLGLEMWFWYQGLIYSPYHCVSEHVEAAQIVSDKCKLSDIIWNPLKKSVLTECKNKIWDMG